MVKFMSMNEVTGDNAGSITHAKFKYYHRVITNE